MKTNKIFRKLIDGALQMGVELSSQECAKFSKWVFGLFRENQKLMLKLAELKKQTAGDVFNLESALLSSAEKQELYLSRIAELEKQIASDDSGSYDSLIPDWAYWIKFKDRLPEEGWSIVAVDKETKTVLGFIFTKQNAFRDYLVLNFDYWLPLPELPEE